MYSVLHRIIRVNFTLRCEHFGGSIWFGFLTQFCVLGLNVSSKLRNLRERANCTWANFQVFTRDQTGQRWRKGPELVLAHVPRSRCCDEQIGEATPRPQRETNIYIVIYLKQWCLPQISKRFFESVTETLCRIFLLPQTTQMWLSDAPSFPSRIRAINRGRRVLCSPLGCE